jgi:FkbM family methyltransferase
MIKKVLKRLFGFLGYTLTKKKRIKVSVKNNEVDYTVSMALTMKGALERTKDRGDVINTVIDVGASDGRWTRNCMKVFGESKYLLIEAQEGHKESLEQFKNEQDSIDYTLAAAGKEKGTIYFDAGDLFGGLASETPIAENGIEVPVVALDDEVERLKLKGPYLLKLDTHGFEVPILEGAKEVLKNAAVVIIETYNFRLTNDSLRYWEMCSYMEKRGFLPVDNVDFMLRSKDKAFWQMDTFFIPKDSEVFTSQKYS